MKKFLALVLAAVMALSMVSVASAAVRPYSTFGSYLVDAVGWYFVNDTTLLVDAEAGTYTLIYKSDIFGTIDPGVKGIKNIVYTGACTVAPAADGEAAHLDVTIDTVDSILFEQHDKAWGRQENINFSCVMDTANWDDVMDDIYSDGCEEFLANYSGFVGTVITVEDVALDYDDVTLVNKIVSGLEDVNLDIQ